MLLNSTIMLNQPLPLAGEFLEPDDVTFSVLMRGYGEMNPPSWVLISGLLKMMDQKFAMKPSLGEASSEKGKWSKSVIFLYIRGQLIVPKFVACQ